MNLREKLRLSITDKELIEAVKNRGYTYCIDCPCRKECILHIDTKCENILKANLDNPV